MQRILPRVLGTSAGVVVFSALALGACGKGDVVEAPAGGHVQIAVAPLDLPNVTEAVYRLTVRNAANEMVWQKTITSTQYGSGQGAASYVGPCDAQSTPNRIYLELESLSAGGALLSATSDYANPAPLGSPISLSAACAADSDTPVEFNLNIARAGEQGFFDISVNFNDLFCSAKLDCERLVNGVPQPLELLYNPHTGKRDLTAVLGFACTAGPDQDTYLHMSKVAVECAGQTFYVESQLGPGNLNPPFPGPPNTTDLFFQTATYRGQELIGTTNKFYWNVAIGLNEDALAALKPCTLKATATASDGPLAGGETPAGMRWPYIEWNVPLNDAAGAMVCGAHELGGGTQVQVKYTDPGPISFVASIQRSAPDNTVLNGCNPSEVCGACASSCYLGSGTGLDDVTTGGTGGTDAPPLATELETKVNPDDITGLVASASGGLTLADQNYDLPFLWAANSGDNTVSKIDTRNLKEVGRYRVCNNPSRTAVDLEGNAFIACRYDGGVAKIGVIDPECIDRNNNLVIDTSRDTNNNGVIDGGEMLAAGADECVLWTKFPAAAAPYAVGCSSASVCGRAAGVDVNNDVWIGIWANSRLYRLDGATGDTIKSIAIPHRPYGLAIAEDGMIWVASRETNGALMRVNPQTDAVTTWVSGTGNYTGAPSTDNYGISIDPFGSIWLGQYQAKGLKRFTLNADGITGVFSGPYGSSGTAFTRGIGIKAFYDAQGVVTGAEVYSGHSEASCYGTVSYAKLDAAGAVVAHGVISVPGTNGPIGNAIDVDGYIWGVNYCGNSATKYSVSYGAAPNYTPTVVTAGAGLGTVPIGLNPYTYSDMTGQALRNLAGVDGHYRHRWTGWAAPTRTWWKGLNLVASLPGGPTVTWLEVKWRSGDDATALNSAPWTTATTVHSGTTMPLDLAINPTTARIGRYFDLEVVFRTTDPGGQVPELSGIGLVVYQLPPL